MRILAIRSADTSLSGATWHPTLEIHDSTGSDSSVLYSLHGWFRKCVSFWYDLWSSLRRLYLVYPFLHSFAIEQTCTVASQAEEEHWDVKLLLPLTNSAQQELWLATLWRSKVCSDAGCDHCPALESIGRIVLHCKNAGLFWVKLGVQRHAAEANSISIFIEQLQKPTGSKLQIHGLFASRRASAALICKKWPECSTITAPPDDKC
jgi:hypothetical protein